MLGSQILDVAIGLVFIYLLLSLVVSAFQEVLASIFKWRAENLWEGVQNLLGARHSKKIAKQVYDHPLVKGLTRPGKKPTYIPSRIFVLALLETIHPSRADKLSDLKALQAGIKELPEDLQKSLTALLLDAGPNLEEFKTRLEVWYNDGMDRVIGWYKRRTQTVLLLLGFGIALWLNADTIQIARKLYSNPEKRAAILEKVKTFQTTAPDAAASESAKDLRNELDAAAAKLARGAADVQATGLVGWAGEAPPRNWRESLSKLAGLVITALAISLGAPFWFDLLNRFMNVRAAGKAPEEEPKKPKEVPQPREPGSEPDRASPQP